jgi:hypothetical protein
MLAQPDDIDSPFSAVEVEVATGPRGSLMDKLAWVLSATIIAVAIVGAVCNALVRNTVAAIALSISCSFALWWYLTARHDPFWMIAAFVVVPIIIAVSVFMGMLGRASRHAIDAEG